VVTCNVTNKQYVGQCADPAARWAQHKSRPPLALRRDAKSLGFKVDNETCSMQVMGVVYSSVAADLWEQRTIKQRGTLVPHGYNICPSQPGQQFWTHKSRRVAKDKRDA
jgi:hypothetical protein